jgi:ketopantoate reductase
MTTKTQETPGAADRLRRLVGPGTAVAVPQNGMDHAERVAPPVPEGTPVLPVLVCISAERTAPGRTAHHIGETLLVPDTPPAGPSPPSSPAAPSASGRPGTSPQPPGASCSATWPRTR